MKRTCIYHLVFNRKKLKLSPEMKALLQIEIFFPNGKKKYLSTGIYLLVSEWDKSSQRVVNNELGARLNKHLSDRLNALKSLELKCLESGRIFSPVLIDSLLDDKGQQVSFYQFAKREIKCRMDIGHNTKMHHLNTLEVAYQSGIRIFNDLTIENIKKFDRHLYSTGKKSTTIYNYHKNLKTYINIAIKEGLFLRDQNPYEIFETKKGRFALRVRLDDNEMLAIETTVITHPDIDMVRNIFIFCMYTGIAYGDCQKLTSQNLKFIESQYWIEGLRKKSGEFYSVPLLDQPLSIVEMYKGKEFLFPRLSHYQYNRRLKTLANLCEINKNITSHTARHTCATFLLRKGVSLKVISEILGHSLLRTTEVYAKLEKERMKEEFDVLREKLKKTGGCNRKHLIK